MESLLVGIVTTLKNPGSTLESWLEYHLSQGFDKIFLFFDDPQDESIPLCKQCDQNKIEILCANYLEQSHLPSYASMSPYLTTEVQARQHLNAEIALDRCRALNIKWLLHIDIDELFYCTKDIKEHFLHLEKNNIGTLTYANYEAVPEQFDMEDYFVSCTLFRKHLSHVPLSGPAATCLNYWKQKTNHGQYFIAYDIGKSVTRVVDGVIPLNVHNWKLPADCSSQTVTAITDVRNMNLNSLFQVEDAFILHYVACGYRWWKEKYRILDVFPDAWFGGKMKIQPSFHLDSRDVYLTGDESKREQFYREQVVTNQESEISNQIKHGLCVRLTQPRDIILKRFPNKEQTDTNENTSTTKETLSSRSNQKPKTTPSESGTVSLDQMWIVSSLVGKYLNNDK